MPSSNGRGDHGSAMGRLWRRLWNTPPPTWGCEISPSGISLARWTAESDGLDTVAWRPLSAGAIEVSPLRENLQRPVEIREALAACMDSLGRPASPNSSARPADVALVIPDQAARLFVLNFDAFPQRPAEAIPLVQWRLKKSVPFDIESAVVSYFARRRQGQWQVVAVVTPQGIVRQYEEVAESAGLRPRTVTLSTLASLGLVPELQSEERATEGKETRQTTSQVDRSGPALRDRESVLVAKFSPPWFTTAIVHSGSVCLFRTVAIGDGGEAPVVSAKVLEAIYPAVAYFQDNFGTPLEKAFLCGLGENSSFIAKSLEQELHLSTQPLCGDWDQPMGGWNRYQAERHLAALWGIVREQRRG